MSTGIPSGQHPGSGPGEEAGRVTVSGQEAGNTGHEAQEAGGRSAMPADQAGLPDRTIVLVGLMGAGKTAIGRRLAQRIGRPFVDADREIEEAAGCTIEDIFQRYGEAAFRDVERRVIARLMAEPPQVLATGGGAFMNGETRALIKAGGLSIWLRADLDLLVERTGRRNNRPLLKAGNPREILSRLIDERYPVYAEADITVDSHDGPAEQMVDRVLDAMHAHLAPHDG